MRNIVFERILAAIAIFMAVFIAGCANRAPINNQLSFQKRFSIINQQLHNKLHTWQLNGKIYWQNKIANQSATCYINWQKFNNKSQITLYSALNIHNVVIESDNNNQIKILSKNGKQYNNRSDNQANADPEFNQLKKTIDPLLSNLNLNNLSYWLLGIPNPLKNYSLIKDGFKQDRWLITYSDYQTNNLQNVALPKKIIMKNSNKKNIIIIKIIVLNFKH